MEKILSKLSRKPSGIDEVTIKESGWYDARERIFDHLEGDQVLQRLIKKFNVIDDRMKLIKSTKDMKITFHVMQSSYGYEYTYARTQFVIRGKRKDFRKYLGKTEEVDLKKIDLSFIKKYFLDVLKNYLEYQE